MTTTERTCGNCGCFAHMKPDGTITSDENDMAVCRRNPPGGRFVRVEVPVVKDGAPVVNARGKPQLEPRNVLQIGYPPTVDTAVCFDGWRPATTQPGERWAL